MMKIGLTNVYMSLFFTAIDGGARIISFRKANPREVKRYEKAQSLLD